MVYKKWLLHKDFYRRIPVDFDPHLPSPNWSTLTKFEKRRIKIFKAVKGVLMILEGGEIKIHL